MDTGIDRGRLKDDLIRWLSCALCVMTSTVPPHDTAASAQPWERSPTTLNFMLSLPLRLKGLDLLLIFTIFSPVRRLPSLSGSPWVILLTAMPFSPWSKQYLNAGSSRLQTTSHFFQAEFKFNMRTRSFLIVSIAFLLFSICSDLSRIDASAPSSPLASF